MGLEEIHSCCLRLSLIIYFFPDVELLSEDKLRMQLPQNNDGLQNKQVDIDPPEKFLEVSFLGRLCIIL